VIEGKEERDERDSQLPHFAFCILGFAFCIPRPLAPSPPRLLAPSPPRPSRTPATSAEAVEPPGQARWRGDHRTTGAGPVAGRSLPHPHSDTCAINTSQNYIGRFVTSQSRPAFLVVFRSRSCQARSQLLTARLGRTLGGRLFCRRLASGRLSFRRTFCCRLASCHFHWLPEWALSSKPLFQVRPTKEKHLLRIERSCESLQRFKSIV
jgi:hypothetical protein